MFWTRLASGVVLVILSIVTLYFGGLVTLGVTAVLSLIGIFELCRVYKIEKKAPAIAAYIWTILYYLLLGFDLQKWVMPLRLCTFWWFWQSMYLPSLSSMTRKQWPHFSLSIM